MADSADYTTSFIVTQTPAEAFAAVVNVRGWWSERIEGHTDKAGETFRYTYGDMHRCRIDVTRLVPGKTVAWHVAENYFGFTADTAEWTGTDIVFDIAETPDGTRVTFTHVGLAPHYECYDVCSSGWDEAINGSLRSLIASGRGAPNTK